MESRQGARRSNHVPITIDCDSPISSQTFNTFRLDQASLPFPTRAGPHVVHATQKGASIITAPQKDAMAVFMPNKVAARVVPPRVTESPHSIVESHRHAACERGSLFRTDTHLIDAAADTAENTVKPRSRSPHPKVFIRMFAHW